MHHEGFADNSGVHLQYVRRRVNSSGGVPVVVIPGMVESAEEYADYFREVPLPDAVFMSLRGRGTSDAPDHGYSFEEQLSDVEAVIEHLALHHCILIGFSVGASFAIAYTLAHPEQVRGLILVDYPPHYPSLPESWITAVTESDHDVFPFHVAQALVRESERVVFSRELPMIPCATLVIRGAKEGSLLPAEIAALYTDRIPQCIMLVLENMGHDPFEATRDDVLKALTDFERNVTTGQ